MLKSDYDLDMNGLLNTPELSRHSAIFIPGRDFKMKTKGPKFRTLKGILD